MAPADRRLSQDLCEVDFVHPEAYRRAKSTLLGDGVYGALADLFGALADPTRAKIVHVLRNQELCSCDVAAVAGVTKPGASQHLRLLRTLRLVRTRRAGRLVYYSLDDEHVAMLLRIGLAHLGHSDASAGIAEDSTREAAPA
jgi:ArsR family transcriptional regulator, lead/cadmium/zinc/bismuth-responsive transcriptional repressor